MAQTVDNTGVVRVKAAPLERPAVIAATGVGASPCFETVGADDHGGVGGYLGGPDGDLLVRAMATDNARATYPLAGVRSAGR